MPSSARYIISIVLVLAAAAGAVFTVVQRNRNPMEARWASVQEELSMQGDVVSGGNFIQDHDFRAVYDWLAVRPRLWRPLVAPPKDVKNQAPDPTAQQKLNGIRIGRSEEMTTVDGARLILVYDNSAKTKQWLTVGDRVRDLTIAEIRDDRVVFHFTFRGKTITYDWARR